MVIEPLKTIQKLNFVILTGRVKSGLIVFYVNASLEKVRKKLALQSMNDSPKNLLLT